MGAYLSGPVTEKISSDEAGKYISYGAASMQGWRVNQEDAHNCVIDYDEGDTSFFAVYDGHGGAEVAKYCAMHLPDFIKSLPSYKQGNLETALSEGFLKFDATLITPEVLAKLKLLTGTKSDGELSGADSTEEDEAVMLEAEADMPIEKVLERYGAKLRMKLDAAKGEEGADSGEEGKEKEAKLVNGDSTATGVGEDGEDKASKAQSSSAGEPASEAEPRSPSSSPRARQPIPSGDQPLSDVPKSEDDCGEGSSGASGDLGRLHRSKPYTALIMDEEISDSSEDSAESSQDDDDAEEENDDDDAEEEENDDEEEGDADESDAWNLIKKRRLAQQDALSSLDVDVPGYDSGCTAVVGVLKGRKLLVANAGDSRCVVCRSGKAVDMSVDHKPEDTEELRRITKAGGEVTKDGRVNGGLNLSRAIGDHAYKRTDDLGPEEQMITALPDIRTLDIDPETDKFMVLACDGIWNSMTSDEVVSFVAEKLKEGVTPLSKICEMIFDVCLAPNTTDDGTGCDNMTCIVVQFHEAPSDSQKKRPASTNGEEDNPKKKSRTESSPGEPVPNEEGST